ncbi:MAG: cell division protein FtsQ/DivIB [Gammaproteobacteria bacterium]|nr:cell division protein FtsQ/DivIB [Gammaproteobacteria bacterium]
MKNKLMRNLTVKSGPIFLALTLMLFLIFWPGISSFATIENISIGNPLKYVRKNNVEQLLQDSLKRSFFELNIKNIASKLDEIPWVDSAEVRKVWPNLLYIEIKEQAPLAKWEEDSLISESGELFSPDNLEGLDALPKLFGREQDRKKIMEFYNQANVLLKEEGLKLVRLEMNSPFKWTLKLHNGLDLVLSKEQGLDKLRQFRLVYGKHIAPQLKKIASIDLRYDSGMALSWHDA